ncbi:MAG: hypothetical protein RR054_04425 [Clostridia bacterium]
MGWFGDYRSSQDVADEIIKGKYNDKIGYIELLDSKITKTKGALLLSSKNMDYKFIYFYIFKDEMYKSGSPCSMYAAENFVPQSWHKICLPYYGEYELKMYKEMLESIKIGKESAKIAKLQKEEIKEYLGKLLSNKNNRYNAKDYNLYNIKYAFYNKGYIFESNGKYIRLKNINKNSLELIIE